jgi:ribA/ribD-fused uncharacterized protein
LIDFGLTAKQPFFSTVSCFAKRQSGEMVPHSRILAAKSPSDAKRLGREVKHFHEELWQAVILRVAFESVYQKFLGLGMESNETIALMKTKDALIVEAAPGDRIWGVGRPCRHPDCQNPRMWGSGNVLGYALMKARNGLRQRAMQMRNAQTKSKLKLKAAFYSNK